MLFINKKITKIISLIVILTFLTLINGKYTFVFANNNQFYKDSAYKVIKLNQEISSIFSKNIDSKSQKIRLNEQEKKVVNNKLNTIKQEVNLICNGLIGNDINEEKLIEIIRIFKENIYYSSNIQSLVNVLKFEALQNNYSQYTKSEITTFISLYETTFKKFFLQDQRLPPLSGCVVMTLSCGCIIATLALGGIAGYLVYCHYHIANPPVIHHDDDHHDDDGAQNLPQQGDFNLPTGGTVQAIVN